MVCVLSSDNMKHVHNDADFDSELKAAGSKLVVVDFYATWFAVSLLFCFSLSLLRLVFVEAGAWSGFSGVGGWELLQALRSGFALEPSNSIRFLLQNCSM